MGTAMSRNSGVLAESVSRISVYLRLLGGDGIVFAPGLRPTGIDRALVRGNRVTGVLGDAIALRTRVVSAQIAGNVAQRIGGGGVVMDETASAQELIVDSNQLFDVVRRGDADAGPAVAGIWLAHVVDAVVSANQIRSVARTPSDVLVRAGVAGFAVHLLRVSSNSILDLGGVGFSGAAIGIAVLGSFDRVDVLDNTIRRAAATPDPKGIADAWAAIGIIGFGPAQDDDPDEPLFDVPAPVVAAGAKHTFTIQEAAGRIAVVERDLGSIGVRGNVADALGSVPAITLVTTAACVLGENRVTLATNNKVNAAIRAIVGTAAVSANHVRASRGLPAIDLRPVAGAFTVLGNVTTGPIDVNGAPLAGPWDVLNA
jgi:hypothetical protein